MINLVYATTVQQPVSYSYNIDYKSTATGLAEIGYDFNFEEEKSKARPKTPYKRKKMYEEVVWFSLSYSIYFLFFNLLKL